MGTPTAGHLNVQGAAIDVHGPVPRLVTVANVGCTDDDGASLAGGGATLDRFVEDHPSDAARGVDTQLEAAAAIATESPGGS